MEWWNSTSPGEGKLAWIKKGNPPWLIVEIRDDDCYTLGETVSVGTNGYYEFRAGQGHRPILIPGGGREEVVFKGTGSGANRGTLVLDGLLLAEKQLVLQGSFREVIIRHCSVVPGICTKDANRVAQNNVPRLALRAFQGVLRIEHSVVGPMVVYRPARDDHTRHLPPKILISDSVLDNSCGKCASIGSDIGVAFAEVRLERCTVLGKLEVHALDLAQDSLLCKQVLVARQRQGCVRHCYVAPGSVTPQRYRCVDENTPRVGGGADAPVFLSKRYGSRDYVMLAPQTPDSIRRGASDQGEMGVYHDEYIPQREDNLRARLRESELVGTEIQPLFFPNQSER